jgi:hypothetical protein
MDTLWKKLAFAVFVGGVVVAAAYGLSASAERTRLMLEGLNHLGIVIIAIAAVEVVWAWAGGSPTELDLKRLISLSEGLNNEMKGDVATLNQTSDNIKATSERIEASMQHMTIIVTAASRTGLWNVGAREDELGYPPSKFATEVMNARYAVDLCGCTLRFVYSNDVVLDALVKTAARGVPIRILVSGPESPLLAANFKDSFEDDVRQGSRFLLKRILERNSNINVQTLTVKCMTLSLLRIDEVMLVMPYLYSVQTSESPHFDVRGSGNPLFRAYQAEFDALFAISKPGSLPSATVS